MAQSADDTKLNKDPDIGIHVKVWRYGIYGVIATVVFAYFIYFGLILGQPPAQEAQFWGSFGDFVGGLLNPLVAFAALYWLTESVKIQKQELKETRRELEKQADNGRDSVHLAAITALANLHLARVAGLDRGLEATSRALAEAGSYLNGRDTPEKAEVRKTHQNLLDEVLQCEREYKTLMEGIQKYVSASETERTR